ncbi:MAG TPA: hypothetical protein VG269_00115 [Tepidisphaeraceae bacterium]|jgi:hypothetical protein|nr:hypothetical protein [Tepidisphaeraceae bacterium]
MSRTDFIAIAEALSTIPRFAELGQEYLALRARYGGFVSPFGQHADPEGAVPPDEARTALEARLREAALFPDRRFIVSVTTSHLLAALDVDPKTRSAVVLGYDGVTLRCNGIQVPAMMGIGCGLAVLKRQHLFAVSSQTSDAIVIAVGRGYWHCMKEPWTPSRRFCLYAING